VIACEGWVRRLGQDRRCTQTVGVTSWLDHTGRMHSACSRHRGGLARLYPAELPERVRPRGTLGLGTPWTRGAFAPADRIDVENHIPVGYMINIIGRSPRTFVVVGLKVSPDPMRWGSLELFRTPPTTDPYRVALAMCERLALHAAEVSHAG
jgi:hypothetical protein